MQGGDLRLSGFRGSHLTAAHQSYALNMRCGVASNLFALTKNFNRSSDCAAGKRSIHLARRALFSTDAYGLSSKIEVKNKEEEVVIAIGSNVGNRISNFNKALELMRKSGICITRHGCLYETEPAYVTDQPLFLNSAIRATTKLSPHDLLKVLKEIEDGLGRTEGIRYGPRPIDLDIIFYGKARISSDILTIPHKNLWERPFVLAPLIDLFGSIQNNDNVADWHSSSGRKGGIFDVWEELGGDRLIGSRGIKRVIPVGNALLDWSRKTYIMGVLNLTPDSFSDGGKYLSVQNAVARVRSMLSEGVDIIDIGAQSTRPGATKLTAKAELSRLLPVLEALKDISELNGKLLSVDTFYAEVASKAVEHGVHIVNDVSGGLLDEDMFPTVASLGVPYVLMHLRGEPSTMQNENNTNYSNVCKEVASDLCNQLMNAESSGIPAWRIIIDPGIGFAKTFEHNVELLKDLSAFREKLAAKSIAASHAPLLIGPSRKAFLGKICHRPKAEERDPATIAAVAAGVLAGANIVRVHNVKDNMDAVKVCDALRGRAVC